MHFWQFYVLVAAGLDERSNRCDCSLRVARSVCEEWRMPLDQVMQFCQRHGGHCDCEVCMNMHPHDRPEIEADWWKQSS